MPANYHSIISIVKLRSCSAWDFIGTFFRKLIFNIARFRTLLSALLRGDALKLSTYKNSATFLSKRCRSEFKSLVEYRI